MPRPLDLTLEIQHRNGRLLGLLHHSDRSFTETLEDLPLGETAKLKVKGRVLTLGALVGALAAYRDEDLAFAFDERGQLEIDRVAQFSIVAQETWRMLKEGRPRCRAFVWYGRIGEGGRGHFPQTAQGGAARGPGQCGFPGGATALAR